MLALLMIPLLLLLLFCSLYSFFRFLPQKLRGQTQRALLSGLHPQAISMQPSGEGWIVGRGFSPHDLDLRASHTGNLRYINGQWSPISSPQVIFSSLAVIADNDVWAGTDDGFYHWNGTQWTRDPSFTFPKGLFAGSSQNIVDISMISPTEGWALSQNRTDNLIHYIKGKWQVGGSLVTDKYYSLLTSVSMVSPDDGWAVGYHFIAHYNGKQWSLVNTPVLKHTDTEDISLVSVKMISHNQGWAVGNIGPRYQQSASITPQKGVILQYTNGSWQIVKTVPLIISGFSIVSKDELWVVGTMASSNTNFYHYLKGTWTAVDRPQNAPRDVTGAQNVISISMLSSTEGWGISEDGIFRYHNGSWNTWHVRGPNEIV